MIHTTTQRTRGGKRERTQRERDRDFEELDIDVVADPNVSLDMDDDVDDEAITTRFPSSIREALRLDGNHDR